MSSFNRVMLMGNLTRDVDMKYTQGGTPLAEIGLAVNEKRKDRDGSWVNDVVFVDVVLWGKNAENAAQYLYKGSPLFIEGKLKLDQWEKDGKKFSRLRVVGERMQFIGGGSRHGGGIGHSDESDEAYSAAVDRDYGPDDDIPF